MRYESHGFNCCANLGPNPTWQPGQQVTLEWQTINSRFVDRSTAQPVTLTLTLTGPFDSVALLKAGGAAPIVFRDVRHLDDRSAPPALTLALPADLRSGFYNLAQNTDWGGGNSAGGAAVIRIG